MKESQSFIISFMRRRTWRDSTALVTGTIALTAALGQLVATTASANPEGGSIVEGEATISSNEAGELTINQSDQRAVIEWDSFSIDEGEHTRFVQPDASAVTLNRVTGDQLSEIAGKLTANGKIILVNPNGIMFTGTAEVDVGSLIASTSDVDNNDILNENNNVFAFSSGPLSGTIINDGDVTVSEGGLAAFVAPYVRNNGNITARLGRVTLASGNIFTVDLNGDGLTQLGLSGNFDNQGQSPGVDVTGDGLIQADGGLVVLSVSDASLLIDSTINMDGIIRARSVENQNGKIILGGHDAITVVRGDLDASGQETGMVGGEITLAGRGIVLTDTAYIDASGSAGGGRVDIGQKENPAEPDHSPTAVVLAEKGATVSADSNSNGNGGQITVTAEDGVLFYGRASAQAGSEGGDGGSIELVSGNRLGITQARFDATAPSGTEGQLRLEGSNILIADVQTPDIDGEDELESEESGDSLEDELTILDDGTILSRDTVERTLGDGTSIAIFASDANGGDILIGADIDHQGDREVRLILDAKGDVSISGKIASTENPLQVEVHAGGNISFESFASSVGDIAEDILSALIGDSDPPSATFETSLPALSSVGAITTSGDAILNATGSVRNADVEASAVLITANSGIEGQTATADLTLINQDGGGIDIDNVGDTTLRLRDGAGYSTLIDNTGNLTLAEFEAEDSDVEISATGDIDALTTIGTDDAPVYNIWLRAGRDLDLVGAVSSNGQILVGQSVTLAGSYRTNGGRFVTGDADTPRPFVIDGSSGPVVIDTSFAVSDSDVDISYESASYNSITFNGTLDGTNSNADTLTLRVGDGDVTFNGDVGGNVPLGTLRIEGNADATSVDVSNVTTDEDVSVALSIGSPNGSVQSFSLSGLPVGSTLDDGVNPSLTIETADQTVDLTQFDLDSLRFEPLQNSDNDASVKVTLIVPSSNNVTLPESGVFNVANLVEGSSAESNFAVIVDPIVDGTDVQATESDWSGNRLPVQINATLLDTDGSESAIILVDDLPEGTSLSAGTQNPDGSFSLTLAELNNLELISTNDGDLASVLSVSAITTEINDSNQTALSASITLAIPARPVELVLPAESLADSRIVLEGAGQQGPVGDALRPNRRPDASPIVSASSREDSPEDLEDPIDPFAVEPAAGEDEVRSEAWEACPDIVEASVSWQNTASDAAFNVNPNMVPYSVDVYCGGYQVTAAGRGVSEGYQDLSFVSRDFWTDLKQERTPSLIEELRSDRPLSPSR